MSIQSSQCKWGSPPKIPSVCSITLYLYQPSYNLMNSNETWAVYSVTSGDSRVAFRIKTSYFTNQPVSTYICLIFLEQLHRK